MFPINWNDLFRKKDGTLTTMENVGGGGGGNLPPHSSSDAGKVLTVGEDGTLEWDVKGGLEGKGYLGNATPDNSLGINGEFYIQSNSEISFDPLIPPQSTNDNVFFSDEWEAGSGQAFHLFDGSNSTYWSTHEDYNTNQYCGFDFGNNPVIANRVTIVPREYSGNLQINDFRIEASNDNTNWNTLFSGRVRGTGVNEFNFVNGTPYRYYRLFVLNASGSRTITVFEMQLYNRIATLNIEKVYKKISGSWVEI